MKKRPTDELHLDLDNGWVWQGRQQLTLPPKAFRVLRYLAEHAGQLVSKEELLRVAWPNVVVSEWALTTCLREIRKALKENARTPRYIQTVHRRGYRLITPISTAAPPVVSSQFSGVRKEEKNQKAKGKRQKAKVAETQSSVLSPLSSVLVGREAELAQLHNWLDKALSGQRQIVFVTGEAGIGKTTVVETFLHSLAPQEANQKAKIKNQKLKVSEAQPSVLSPQPLSSPNSKFQIPNPRPWIARGQCIDHYGPGEAYLPVLEALGRLCQGPEGQRCIALLDKVAPSWLVQLPAVLEVRAYEALQQRTRDTNRVRMVREAAEALEALTAERPLILCLEDLQWSDVSTLDLLAYVARRSERARLLVLGTYRPVEVIIRGHPLRTLKQELQVHGQCQDLPLEVLSEVAVEGYVAQRFTFTSPELAGEGLPVVTQREVAHVLHQRTEGHPLFMVAVVEYWLARGLFVNVAGHWEGRAKLETLQSGVPPGVQQMIAAQLDRLTPMERRVVEVGSVAGVEFSAATVAAGIGIEVVEAEALCADLAQRQFVLWACGEESWSDGTMASRYRFRHALHQEIIYARLPAARRGQWHHQVGLRKEQGYGTQAKEIAAELAVHFAQGHDYRRAVQYLEAAAQTALRRRAPQEAILHLTQALELLARLPDTPERAQQELSLLIALGVPLLMTKGYAAAEVERTYARARALCQQIDDTPQLFLALTGLCWYHLVRVELQTARAIGEQLLLVAQRLQDPALLLQAHLVLGIPLFHLGEFAASSAHLQQAVVLYDSQRSNSQASLFPEGYEAADPDVHCRPYAALALYYQGYAEQARKKSLEAVAFAQALALPFPLGAALVLAAVLHQSLQEDSLARERAEAAITLSSTHGFPHWLPQGMILRGWALARQRQTEEGVSQMRQGLAAHQATGTELARASYLSLLAETLGTAGQPEEGLALLAEAENFVRQTGERFYEAELYRLKGELLLTREIKNQKLKVKNQKYENTDLRPLAPDPQGEAEACFFKAIAIAQKQQAKSFELRATVSLVRLRQQQAKNRATRTAQYDSRATLDEAHHMLSEIYHWFTEGFDTPALQEAKALLEELSD